MARKLFWAALALLAMAGCQRQDAYPSRPIVLICPWAAGGGTDRVSRQVAVQLEQELGVPVNVVNATGGGGVTGHTRGALARPDGYTLIMITPELNMLHWRGMTSITYRNFDPLVMVNRDPAALFVRQDAPWPSAAELLAAAREKPRSLRASGTSFGGIWHLSLAGWLQAAGLPVDAINWVPHGGSAPSLQELIAGGVEVVCCSVPEAQALLDGGRIRCLAVMADQRLPALPEVPTLKEEGMDWTVLGWRGLALPPQVPAETREKLRAGLQRVADSVEYRQFLKTAGFGAAAEPTEAFRDLLRQDDQRYGKLLTSEEFGQVQRQRFGPMVFPVILIGLLILAVLAVWLGGGRPAQPFPLTRDGLRAAGLALAWVVLYLLLAERIGFVLTVALLLLVMWRRLGVRWQVGLPLAALLACGTYQLFAVWLRVPLPWGWLGW